MACNRHIALLDVVLLHADDEAVNGGNVVNRVVVRGEFGLWGHDSRACREECCDECEGCPNDGIFHVLILLFDIVFLLHQSRVPKLLNCGLICDSMGVNLLLRKGFFGVFLRSV